MIEKLEARAGIEPAHKGFADLYRSGQKPSVYAGPARPTPHFGPTLVRPLTRAITAWRVIKATEAMSQVCGDPLCEGFSDFVTRANQQGLT